jgi:hypothetical protein
MAGVSPVCSPPYADELFNPIVLEGHDLLILNLHGERGDDMWYGESSDDFLAYRVPALSAKTLRMADLGGTVVFAINCWLADSDSPMLAALRDAGARWIIAGDGLNYGGRKALAGADILGLWLRVGMESGLSAKTSFRLARLALKLRGESMEIRDTLRFSMLKGFRDGQT